MRPDRARRIVTGSFPTLGTCNDREIIPRPVGKRLGESHDQRATGSDKISEQRRDSATLMVQTVFSEFIGHS
jgi:hypothetical protein